MTARYVKTPCKHCGKLYWAHLTSGVPSRKTCSDECRFALARLRGLIQFGKAQS